MTKAVTLAFKFLIRFDRRAKELFTFLSLCVPQSLNVDIAIKYIVILHEHLDEADRELILMMLMRRPLLLVEEKDASHFIRAHQLVHDAIRIVLYESHERQNLVSLLELSPHSTNLYSLFHVSIEDCTPCISFRRYKPSVCQFLNSLLF